MCSSLFLSNNGRVTYLNNALWSLPTDVPLQTIERHMSIIPLRHAPPILISAMNLNYEHIIGDFSKSFWVILLKFLVHIKDMYANIVFDF